MITDKSKIFANTIFQRILYIVESLYVILLKTDPDMWMNLHRWAMDVCINISKIKKFSHFPTLLILRTYDKKILKVYFYFLWTSYLKIY